MNWSNIWSTWPRKPTYHNTANKRRSVCYYHKPGKPPRYLSINIYSHFDKIHRLYTRCIHLGHLWWIFKKLKKFWFFIENYCISMDTNLFMLPNHVYPEFRYISFKYCQFAKTDYLVIHWINFGYLQMFTKIVNFVVGFYCKKTLRKEFASEHFF